MKTMVLALAMVTASGQTPDQRTLDAARAVMAAAQFCFLVTLDRSGQPQARLMEPFPPEADMTVWMGTNPATRKTEQIRKNPRATLACHDAKGPNYVTLIGAATLVEDVAERRRRWKPGWAAFYPGGPDQNYVLVRFTPSRIELVSNTHGIANAPATPGPAILERKGKNWVLSHQR